MFKRLQLGEAVDPEKSNRTTTPRPRQLIRKSAQQPKSAKVEEAPNEEARKAPQKASRT
jgi:hypothetical protein